MAFGNGPRIVTNGLTISLDAGDNNSYVSGSTTWKDVSGNNYTASLINGPSYNFSNQGNIYFDGINDYVRVKDNSTVGSNVTMLFFVSGNYQNFNLCVFERASVKGAGSTVAIPYNGWVQLGYSWDGTTNYFIINGVKYSANSGGDFPYDRPTHKPLIWVSPNGPFGTNAGTNMSFHLQPSAGGYTGHTWSDYTYKLIGVTATAGNQRYFSGSMATVHIYNRFLTDSELLQNYNALKPRFNL